MAQHLSWEMTNVRTIWAKPSVYSTCYRSLRFQGLLAHNRLESLRYYAASSLYAEFHMKRSLRSSALALTTKSPVLDIFWLLVTNVFICAHVRADQFIFLCGPNISPFHVMEQS